VKRFQKTKNNLIYHFIRGAISLAGRLPLAMTSGLFGAAGLCVYCLSAKNRKVAQANIELAYGDAQSATWKKRLARDSFRNLGINAAALLRSYALDDRDELAKFVEIRGMEHMHAACRAGRGVVIISAHIGVFDFIPQALNLAGVPVSSVGARSFDERLDRYIVDIRTRHGNDYIPRDEPPRRILRALQDNRGVGLLIDQDTKVASCFVPFFGKLCSTPVGPAKIVKNTGAPVVLATTFRDRNGKHIVDVRPMEWIERPDKQDELVANTAHWTAMIEQSVREHPEQWVWMHKRWKRQPKS